MGEVSYKLDFRYEPDYLYAKATGIRSLEAILTVTKDCLAECDKHGYKKLIVNVQEMTGSLTIQKSYSLGAEHFEKLRRHERFKTTVLDLAENRERYGFLETVLVNRGFRIRFFSDAGDAERWLGES